MALIKCPDCGKEVSDKAEACIHCGCPIEKAKKNIIEKAKKNIIEKGNVDYFEMLSITSIDKTTKGTIAVFGNSNGIRITVGELVDLISDTGKIISSGKIDNISKINGKKKTKNYFVFFIKPNEQDFDKCKYLVLSGKEFKLPLDIEHIIFEDLMDNQNLNPVRCPRCGSTQIQAVPHKWSLITGFLTNKVDRVCMNCKHKF